jgi:hypothetical protein
MYMPLDGNCLYWLAYAGRDLTTKGFSLNGWLRLPSVPERSPTPQKFWFPNYFKLYILFSYPLLDENFDSNYCG